MQSPCIHGERGKGAQTKVTRNKRNKTRFADGKVRRVKSRKKGEGEREKEKRVERPKTRQTVRKGKEDVKERARETPRYVLRMGGYAGEWGRYACTEHKHEEVGLFLPLFRSTDFSFCQFSLFLSLARTSLGRVYFSRKIHLSTTVVKHRVGGQPSGQYLLVFK